MPPTGGSRFCPACASARRAQAIELLGGNEPIAEPEWLPHGRTEYKRYPNFWEYQAAVRDSSQAVVGDPISVESIALGLIEEVGEIARLLKKQHRTRKLLGPTELSDELGDVCWYGAEAARLLDVPIDPLVREHFQERDYDTVAQFQRTRKRNDSALQAVLILMSAALHLAFVLRNDNPNVLDRVNRNEQAVFRYWDELASTATFSEFDLGVVMAENIRKVSSQ